MNKVCISNTYQQWAGTANGEGTEETQFFFRREARRLESTPKKNFENYNKKSKFKLPFGVRSQWFKTGKILFEVHFSYFQKHV